MKQALVGAEARIERLPALVARLAPDVVVLDVKMPPTYPNKGLRAATALRDGYPSLGLLVLSQYELPSYATQLLEHDAAGVGYLLRNGCRTRWSWTTRCTGSRAVERWSTRPS